jgi:hypothetical protein
VHEREADAQATRVADRVLDSPALVRDRDDDGLGGARDAHLDVPVVPGRIGMANRIGGRFADGQRDIREQRAVGNPRSGEGVGDAEPRAADRGRRGR